MLRASEIHICAEPIHSRNSLSALLGLFALSSLLFASTGRAEVRSPSAPSPSVVLPLPDSKVCAVFAVQDSKERPQQLRAVCKGRVFFLGPVTTFQAVANEGLNAELIEARFDSERRVWLLTVQEDGRTLQEDLTGQIARAAGRGPMSGIEGIELDFKQFAQTGEVGVRERPADRARTRADKIELSQQVNFERARRANRPKRD